MENGKLLEFKKVILHYEKIFNDAFPGIVEELVTEDEQNPQLKTAASLLRDCLNYNAFDGKKSRGKMVICTLHFLRNGNPSKDDVNKAVVLGWCVEILQAFLLVADDIMDKSDMRRGKPCWYKKVGLTAINETYLLEQCIYRLIDKYFSDESYLVNIYKTFHKVTYLTGMGQELDMVISDNPLEEFSLENFNLEKYEAIVKYKTAFYSFYLPVCLGMHLADVKDENLFKEAEKVLLKMGEYFQIQDDYLDCYGDPAVTGKVGRDIEDRKCSWLVVQALLKGSEEDRKVLEENYGKEDLLSVSNVKDLYNKLGMQKLYSTYEDESFKNINSLIQTQGKEFPKELFLFLAQKIYKRQK